MTHTRANRFGNLLRVKLYDSSTNDEEISLVCRWERPIVTLLVIICSCWIFVVNPGKHFYSQYFPGFNVFRKFWSSPNTEPRHFQPLFVYPHHFPSGRDWRKVAGNGSRLAENFGKWQEVDRKRREMTGFGVYHLLYKVPSQRLLRPNPTVGLCRIWSNLVGYGRIRSDLVWFESFGRKSIFG